MLGSSLQSHLFDLVLKRRVADGTWNTVLVGDIAKKHATGGTFLCEDAEDAKRAERNEISATGPIFGAKMSRPEHGPAQIEAEVLAEAFGGTCSPGQLARCGDGSRRSLRMLASELSVEPVDSGDARGALRVKMVLPKGGYATAFLDSACDLVDSSRGNGSAAGMPGADELLSHPPVNSE